MANGRFATLSCLALALTVSGCGSAERGADRAQERYYEAQQEVVEQRLKLVDKYQDCVEDADGDPNKAAACESYLKAADALK